MKRKKKASRPQPGVPARRNPLARQLADRRFGKRVVQSAAAYKRRRKHTGRAGEGEDDGGDA